MYSKEFYHRDGTSLFVTYFLGIIFSCFTEKYPNIEQKLIWEAKNFEVPSWRKVIVELPNDVEEYRLLFEGEYNTTKYWTRNFVTIDNLELRSCYQKGKMLPVISFHLQGKLTIHFLLRVIRYPNLPQKLNELTTPSILFAQRVGVSRSPQMRSWFIYLLPAIGLVDSYLQSFPVSKQVECCKRQIKVECQT